MYVEVTNTHELVKSVLHVSDRMIYSNMSCRAYDNCTYCLHRACAVCILDVRYADHSSVACLEVL